MDTPATIRLLASTNNARGDLFTRLVKDLFFALGYDDLRLDVHKSGREIDIQGTHRLEPRRLVAECKAHAEKMGGEELNKFFGVISRERDRDERIPVSGYFVSLSGFRETGKEQEVQTSEQKRIILLDGQRLIEELIDGRILLSREKAAEKAGGCRAYAGLEAADVESTELLGHDLGYVWAVYYSRNKEYTHFALIHADGTPLSQTVAEAVIQADRECDGPLHNLVYLAPPSPPPDRETLARAAVERYRNWLAAECGEIQLEGLPADSDLAAKRMKLERLFVPSKVVIAQPAQRAGDAEPIVKRTTITPVGEFLGRNPRFSLLAKPGGGKSTLLKRLAVAYAIPARRDATDDGLPERDWLPLFLRSRELRDRAHRPIRELLDDLPKHASMSDLEATLFRAHIDEALRSGRALLLIDGLDEIPDEGARTTFAGHVRTFLAMFPQVAMVVTSREAGYRQVAGVLASACEQVSLAPFDEADVARLCESWHVEVVADSDKVRAEAKALAHAIWGNERIRALAENPLMLTTLFVVKRNVGELPTRRVKLYQAAVDVLIRTWNVEGFKPVDEDETLAQLSYIACAMMVDAQQQISRRRLLESLRQARKELQAELQFAAIGPPEFVRQIEYRSSLLMQTGNEPIDGEFQPVYAFRHLTFQEYLAARGLIEEQYPGRDRGRGLVKMLEPHFADERWREVIALASVLAGRKEAESIIVRLTNWCAKRNRDDSYLRPEDVGDPRVVLLRQCLLDEVQVNPQTLRAALQEMARHGSEDILDGSVLNLRRGKFGDVFEEVVEKAYFGNAPGWEEYLSAMSDLAQKAVLQNRPGPLPHDLAQTLESSLKSGNRIEKCRAAFVVLWLAFLNQDVDGDDRGLLLECFRPLRDAVGRQLLPEDPPLALGAAWALVWMGRARLPETPPEPQVIRSLFQLWREPASGELLRDFAAWALSEQPLLARDELAPDSWGDCDTWLEEAASDSETARAASVIAWYRRAPWNDFDLAAKLREWYRPDPSPTARDMLNTLGDAGRRVLEVWDARK